MEREEYLERMQDYLLLEQAVMGYTTLETQLDEILQSMSDRNNIWEKVDRLLDYAQMMHNLPCDYRHLEYLDHHWDQKEGVGSLKDEGLRRLLEGGAGGMVGGAGIAFILANPVGFGIALGGLCVFAVGALSGTLRDQNMEELENRYWEEVKFLRESAQEIDEEIGKIFLYEHFTDNPWRFELTYGRLGPLEKEDVRAELYRRLDAGLLKTDQQQLDGYLSALDT